MSFRPPACPFPECPSSRGPRFRWCRKGAYLRRCDGRRVQRFLCLVCGRRFSTQTFRLDYRLRLPRLHLSIFDDFVSKVTMRQSARLRGHSRKTVAHRLRLLGEHCRAIHNQRLEVLESARRYRGRFQLDELETFEIDRRLQPVTVPILIESSSYFVIHAETADLPARGRLSRPKRRQKHLFEEKYGKRRSGSTRAVKRSFEVLAAITARDERVRVTTDRKASYATIVRRLFGSRSRHVRASSRERRKYGSALFPINHTLAMVRDNVSRLVRRTWAVSKRRQRLDLHLWIWAVWRNYVRGITVRAPRTTPAMAWGAATRPWPKASFLRWQSRFSELRRDH